MKVLWGFLFVWDFFCLFFVLSWFGLVFFCIHIWVFFVSITPGRLADWYLTWLTDSPLSSHRHSHVSRKEKVTYLTFIHHYKTNGWLSKSRLECSSETLHKPHLSCRWSCSETPLVGTLANRGSRNYKVWSCLHLCPNFCIVHVLRNISDNKHDIQEKAGLQNEYVYRFSYLQRKKSYIFFCAVRKNLFGGVVLAVRVMFCVFFQHT